jgi:dCMP deaminase
MSSIVKYPYLPEGRKIECIKTNNRFMQEAKKIADEKSLDHNVPTGAVLVKDNRVIGGGANGSSFHENNECIRVKNKMPSGQRYDLCEGCDPKNHAEPSAILDAKENGNSKLIKGSSLYLYGHWWCCKPCWDVMIENGIEHVYLAEGSAELFDKKR